MLLLLTFANGECRMIQQVVQKGTSWPSLESGPVMPQIRECPMCEIISPPDTERCECGYTFNQALDPAVRTREGRKLLLAGAGTMGGCLLYAIVRFWLTGRLSSWAVSIAVFVGGPSLLHGLKRLSKERN